MERRGVVIRPVCATCARTRSSSSTSSPHPGPRSRWPAWGWWHSTCSPPSPWDGEGRSRTWETASATGPQRAGAGHHPLLPIRRSLLRQVGTRRRSLRPVRAGGVHAGGVRRADPHRRLPGPAPRGLPHRAAAPPLCRDAGSLLHPCRIPEGWRRGVGLGAGPPGRRLGRRSLGQGRRRARAPLRQVRPGQPRTGGRRGAATAPTATTRPRSTRWSRPTWTRH